MIPIGSIISLAGQAASGIASAINNRRMQRERDAEYARQQAEAEGRAAENPLTRTENQYLLNQYDRDAKRQVDNARNVAKITGATPEYSVAIQNGVAEGKANLMGQMSADASKRADHYKDIAEQSRRKQYAEQLDARQKRNETYANLASNAATAFGSIVDSYATPAVETTTESIDNPNVTAEMRAEHAKANAEKIATAKPSIEAMGKSMVQPAAMATGQQPVNTAAADPRTAGTSTPLHAPVQGVTVGAAPKVNRSLKGLTWPR